jgi:hypothetical protein
VSTPVYCDSVDGSSMECLATSSDRAADEDGPNGDGCDGHGNAGDSYTYSGTWSA